MREVMIEGKAVPIDELRLGDWKKLEAEGLGMGALADLTAEKQGRLAAYVLRKAGVAVADRPEDVGLIIDELTTSEITALMGALLGAKVAESERPT